MKPPIDMFEFLFKFSPVVYREGAWAFRQEVAAGWLLAVAAGLFLVTVWLYRKPASPVSPAVKRLLLGTKFLAMLLLLGVLLEPYVSVTTVVPKKSAVLLLVDDSRSMSIRDETDGNSRVEKVKQWLGIQEENGLWSKLNRNFQVLSYRFSGEVRALNNVADLTARGEMTDIARALEFARKQAQIHPISAVILVTDGAHAPRSGFDTNDGVISDPLQASATLQNAGIPVFPVGVGSEIRQDVQLTKISVKKSVVEDDFVEMSALIVAKQPDGRRVTLQLLEDDRVMKTKEVTLSQKYTKVNFSFKPTRKGFLKYVAAVVPLKDELITTNNARSFLVKNEERVARILYIESLHPSEFKFIKRALDLDNTIQLVSMVRTGPDKFYRQGIAHPKELADGFPSTASDLFEYKALIIGSIEASFFTEKQLRLIKDFVSKRGGGLLMLGGPRAFTNGGWDKTSLTELLPVELISSQELDAADSHLRYSPFQLKLTPEGLRSPMLQLALDPEENRLLWESMPDLRSYNALGRPKPGATVLAVHPLSQPDRPKVIMAQQRYGRGRTMVLATSTTWRWQMRLPSDDMRHEKFWRQITRWLALSAPSPVEVTLDKDTFRPGETVDFHISVLDSSFEPVPKAQVSLEFTMPLEWNAITAPAQDGDPPAGRIHSLDVVPDVSKPGQYRAQFRPEREGLYEVEVLAHDETGKYLGSAGTAFLVENEDREYARPDLHEPLLRRMAEMTGGKYRHIDAADDLADQLTVSPSSYSKVVERDIWDVPAVYLAILLLLAVEWYVRRAKGLS